jgi:integrase
MATLSKRKNSWSFVIEIGKAQGVKVRKRITLPTFKEAKLRMAEVESQVEKMRANKLNPIEIRDALKFDSTRMFDFMRLMATAKEREVLQKFIYPPKSETVTVSEFTDIWQQDFELLDYSPTTQKGYRSIIDLTIKPVFGHIILREVTAFDIEEWKDNQLRAKKRSNTTVNHHLMCLKSMFKRAMKTRYLNSNPMKEVEAPKLTNHEAKFFTIKQVTLLIDELKDSDPEYYVPAITARDTGLRSSELFALTWNDIDFETKVINIDKGVNVIDREFVKHKPKNPTSKRKVKILNDELVSTLQGYKDQRVFTYNLLQKKLKGTDPVFMNASPVTIDGHSVLTRMKPNAVGKHWRKLLNSYTECDHKDESHDPECYPLLNHNWHSLRHTHASILLFNRENIIDVSRRLGHADVGTTYNIYGHLMDEDYEGMGNRYHEVMYKTGS